MSILHMVNKSPFDKTTFKSCLAHASDGDAVLLIEDAVYAVLRGTEAAVEIGAKNGTLSFYVLGPDLAARGIAQSPRVDGIEVVDYGGFVDLAAKHELSQAWL